MRKRSPVERGFLKKSWRTWPKVGELLAKARFPASPKGLGRAVKITLTLTHGRVAASSTA